MPREAEIQADLLSKYLALVTERSHFSAALSLIKTAEGSKTQLVDALMRARNVPMLTQVSQFSDLI